MKLRGPSRGKYLCRLIAGLVLPPFVAGLCSCSSPKATGARSSIIPEMPAPIFSTSVELPPDPVPELPPPQELSATQAAAEPVSAPPDLASWAHETQARQTPPPAPEETASDEYLELVGPFDEKIIEEIAREQAGKAAEAASGKEGEELVASLPPLKEQPAAIPDKAEKEVAYDFPIEFNKQVLAYLEIFKTVRRGCFEKGLGRVKVYEKRMKDILAEEGLPTDLYYLALIESAYNPLAYSRARATGAWQFMESTGRLYGLVRDWWKDERRNPDKATRAAARHLKDLYAELGSWPLALAAYNAGLGRVKRALNQGKAVDYWLLKLPSQTKNYVPAFMAATILAKEPEKYGFFVDYALPLEYEFVTVDECTNLDVIADCAGVSVEEIRQLNPELLRWCTPPMEKDYAVAVPQGTADCFRERYALVPKSEKVNWRRYQIARGDTLSTISRKFGTPTTAIAEVNGLKEKSIIRAGDFLLIPVPGNPASLPDRETGKMAKLVANKAEPSGDRTKLAYRVRPGDNFWYIAQRHGVGVEELKAWNPQVTGDLLHAGDLLTVWSRPDAAGEAAEAADRPQTKFTYQVKKGDTLWSIARRFDMGVQDICRANGFDASKKIFPGDTITIPASGNL